MRCCRTFALAKVEKFRFLASCSAADAMIAYSCCASPNEKPVSTFSRDALRPARSGGCLGFFSLGHIDLAARRFNSRQSTLGGVRHFEGHLLGRKAFAADQADAVALAAHRTRLHEGGAVDDVLGVELAAVDIGLDAVEANRHPLLGVVGVETALWHTHVERHLAALEAADRDARARRLALAATTAGLALARADATANPHAGLVGSRIVAEFVQTRHLSGPKFTCALSRRRQRRLRSNRYYFSTTRTRCGILLIMPRTSGVSLSVRCLRILLRPSPTRVARWSAVRREGLAICSTVTVLSAIYASTDSWPRRAWRSETLRPRRAATERGLSTCLSASKVARTMLYGFEVAVDLAA